MRTFNHLKCHRIRNFFNIKLYTVYSIVIQGDNNISLNITVAEQVMQVIKPSCVLRELVY